MSDGEILKDEGVRFMFTDYFNRISNLTDFFRLDVINNLIEKNDSETIEMLKEAIALPDNEVRNIIIEAEKAEKSSCEKWLKNGEYLLLQPSFYDKNIMEISKAKTAFDWFLDSGTANCYLYREPERNEKDCYAEYILTLLYNSFLRKKHAIHSRAQDDIARVYSAESEYKDYELVSLSQTRELIDTSGRPRLFDKKLKKTFMLQAVKKTLADKLSRLLHDRLIGQLSFRLDNYGIYDGRYTVVPLMEAVEQGKKYSTLALGTDNMVAKLYRDECYGDAVYIFSSPDALTFEEIYENEKHEDDTIVTSVVHLIFTKVETAILIKHIDHEFIFYSRDEYEKKKQNNKQKGQGYKRIKTFKADECSIPIDLPCEVNWKEKHPTKYELIDCSTVIPFIQFVLENCMEHADLICEYFAKEVSSQ